MDIDTYQTPTETAVALVFHNHELTNLNPDQGTCIIKLIEIAAVHGLWMHAVRRHPGRDGGGSMAGDDDGRVGHADADPGHRRRDHPRRQRPTILPVRAYRRDHPDRLRGGGPDQEGDLRRPDLRRQQLPSDTRHDRRATARPATRARAADSAADHDLHSHRFPPGRHHRARRQVRDHRRDRPGQPHGAARVPQRLHPLPVDLRPVRQRGRRPAGPESDSPRHLARQVPVLHLEQLYAARHSPHRRRHPRSRACSSTFPATRRSPKSTSEASAWAARPSLPEASAEPT